MHLPDGVFFGVHRVCRVSIEFHSKSYQPCGVGVKERRFKWWVGSLKKMQEMNKQTKKSLNWMGQENVQPAITTFPSTYEFEIAICFHKLLLFFSLSFFMLSLNAQWSVGRWLYCWQLWQQGWGMRGALIALSLVVCVFVYKSGSKYRTPAL